MFLKMIKTEEDYDQALIEIQRLIISNPAPDSDERNQMEVLSHLVNKYEDENFHFEKSDPIDMIKFIMEQRGLTQKDMTVYIGSKSRVSDVLNRKRPLSLQMIRSLHKGLNISYDLLIDEPDAQINDHDQIDWNKFPLRELQKRGYISSKSESPRILGEYAEELMMPLYSQAQEHCGNFIQLRASVSNFRTKREINSYNLLAWQMVIVKKVIENPLKQKATLIPAILTNVAKFTVLKNGVSLAQDYLRENGIHVVIEPHFQQTYLDGAAFWLKDGAPVIGITLRYDRLDNFWFTLLHELAHLVYHSTDERQSFYDDMDARAFGPSLLEKEADEYAEEALLSTSKWSKADSEKALKDFSPVQIQDKALELGVHPSILAGRVRWDTQNYKRFNRLLGKGIPSKSLQTK